MVISMSNGLNRVKRFLTLHINSDTSFGLTSLFDFPLDDLYVVAASNLPRQSKQDPGHIINTDCQVECRLVSHLLLALEFIAGD